MSAEQEKVLTEADIERIADRAAERALEKVYSQVGKNVVTKVLWLIGVAVLGFAAAKGWFGIFTK